MVRYDWEFGDGTAGVGDTFAHSFPAPGVYDVRLTVTDDVGRTDTRRQWVTVDVSPRGGVSFWALRGGW